MRAEQAEIPFEVVSRATGNSEVIPPGFQFNMPDLSDK
jgi:hypothetical protein